MSISAPDELQLFAQEIQSFLSPSILRDLAGYRHIAIKLKNRNPP